MDLAGRPGDAGGSTAPAPCAGPSPAQVEDPAADLLLSGALKRGDTLRLTAREGRVRVELGVRN